MPNEVKPLTVGQLRDELAKFDQDSPVFIPDHIGGDTEVLAVQDRHTYGYLKPGVEIVGW